MEFVRQDIEMMMDLAAQGTDILRENMGERRKSRGMDMMAHG